LGFRIRGEGLRWDLRLIRGDEGVVGDGRDRGAHFGGSALARSSLVRFGV
jgi:hypothetical protein